MSKPIDEQFSFVRTEGEPNSEDVQTLSKGLLEHHASHGHQRISKKLSIFLKDKNNKAHAGIILTFTWNGMHIDSLWVDDSLRGKNYGTELMIMAEQEAVKRGCTIVYTDTFSWQAPGFYEKLGYTLYGKLDDFPEGSSLSYYYKKLHR